MPVRRLAFFSQAGLDPLGEAIRERVDHLRYAKDYDVRGARIVVGDYVAQYYEATQFRSDWKDPARVDALIAAIADMRRDGLDPADYHLAALQSYRADMNGGKALMPAGNSEVLAVDAMLS
jgi:murein L,D-transpeptidase YcbB/YkuD